MLPLRRETLRATPGVHYYYPVLVLCRMAIIWIGQCLMLNEMSQSQRDLEFGHFVDPFFLVNSFGGLLVNFTLLCQKLSLSYCWLSVVICDSFLVLGVCSQNEQLWHRNRVNRVCKVRACSLSGMLKGRCILVQPVFCCVMSCMVRAVLVYPLFRTDC